MNDFPALIAAILAVPWTLIAFRLYIEPTHQGTSPIIRSGIYIFALLLSITALYGALFD